MSSPTERPFTGANTCRACATGARSISTANGSRTSPPTRRFATPSAPSPGCTTRCTTRSSKDVLTCPTDTGSGGYTHKYLPRAALARGPARRAGGDRRVVAPVLRLDGPHADYKAAYTNTLGANPEYYGPYADNARAWYKRAQETVPFMNHAIVNPPIDRHKPAEQVKDVYVCVKKETDGGIYRLRRQGGRHLGRDHALQLHGPELEDRDRGSGHVADVHGADQRARAEADLPHVATSGPPRATARRSTIRCRRASTRTTRSSSWTTCSSPGRTCSSTAIPRA